MPNKRWVRPTVAFCITFGVLAMVATVMRVILVYRHFYSLDMMPDDPKVAEQATLELSRMDGHYTPIFLLVATVVSGLVAVVFALWRPKSKVAEPPPLPGGPGNGPIETR